MINFTGTKRKEINIAIAMLGKWTISYFWCTNIIFADAVSSSFLLSYTQPGAISPPGNAPASIKEKGCSLILI